MIKGETPHDCGTFQIYRYNPDTDAKPRMQALAVELDGSERMRLDALMKLKASARCRAASSSSRCPGFTLICDLIVKKERLQSPEERRSARSRK